MKKTLGILWEIIKAIYAMVGILIILPFAVIAATSQVLYKNAKTYIQTAIRRKDQR